MEIKHYEQLKEGINVELKKSTTRLPKSIWETISSFSNTGGGTIYLGIDEGKPNIIEGVDDPQTLKKDFFTTLNNKQKISATIINDNDFNIIELDNNFIIEIKVKEAPFYLKPVYLNNNIIDSYIRKGDSDFRCTQIELLSMLNDAKPFSQDTLPNTKGYGIEEIDIDTLDKYRELLNLYSPNNIYINKNNVDFLKSLGFLSLVDEKLVLTNGAVLLFTTPSIIKSIFPLYFLDYQEKDEDELTWNRRVTTDDLTYVGNVFNFYLKVLQLLCDNLPNPFYLEGVVNAGDKILNYVAREALVNAISNCDFNLDNQIKIIKNSNRLYFKNTGKLKIDLKQALTGGNSFPRNSSLMAAFRNIGVCDRGGTGIPRIFEIARKINYVEPTLLLDDESNSTILIFFLRKEATSATTSSKVILEFFKSTNDWISVEDIGKATNYKRSTISTVLRDLQANGFIKNNGNATHGKKFKLN